MQTLVFNSTRKFAVLYKNEAEASEILVKINNVPTVKISEGFYEVYEKDELEKNYPVLRVPIANTNMFIQR